MPGAQPTDMVTKHLTAEERKFRKDAESSAATGEHSVLMALDVAMDPDMRIKFEEMATLYLQVQVSDRLDSDMLNEYVRMHVTLRRRREEFGPIMRQATDFAKSIGQPWTKEMEGYVKASVAIDKQINELHDRVVELADLLLLTPSSRLRHIPRNVPRKAKEDKEVAEALFG